MIKKEVADLFGCTARFVSETKKTGFLTTRPILTITRITFKGKRFHGEFKQNIWYEISNTKTHLGGMQLNVIHSVNKPK